VITRTKDGFLFLGAWCISPDSMKDQYYTKTKGRNPRRAVLRMRILAPLSLILTRLTTNKFAFLDKHGIHQATARKDLTNFTHKEILAFYNQRVAGITSFYSFAGNYSDLMKVILILLLSCALTLTLKYKLRTMRKVFTKFGRNLACPETGASFNRPKSMKVRHDYNNKNLDVNRFDRTLSAS
jgi:hypothetical protein